MRGAWALGVCLAIALADHCFAAEKKDYEACSTEGATPDQLIPACTRIIGDKRESKKIRSSAYFNRGNAWQRKGDNDHAIADYNQALKLDPKLAVAYNNRGLAWANKGDNDHAFADYDKAIGIDPKYAAAYNNRGATWKNKGDNDHAIADYDRAIAVNPKYSIAYKNRGDVWQAEGNNNRANADYDKAIDIDPKYAKAYFARGISQFFSGDVMKSQADFGEYVDILPHETHGAIWFALSEKANNLTVDARATEENLDMNKWPAPVLRLIEGKLQSIEVMAAASDPKEKCEASLYVGVFDQVSKHEADAIQNYRAAYKGCSTDLHKEIARLGLKQLGAAP